MAKFFRRISFVFLFTAFTFVCTFFNTRACTLWAASGDAVEGGGTLIIKNRDWPADHKSQLILLDPQDGFSFLALYSTGGGSVGIKAGINEKGLVVFNASASVVPKEKRRGASMGLMDWLLISCSSVDEVLEEEEFLSGANAGFIMVGDKSKVAVIEIGPENNYSVKEVENGFLYHTNHYLDEDFIRYNEKENESSMVRFGRIKELLEKHKKPFTMEDFIEFSLDKSHGPDNSIWRTGEVKRTETVGTWLVSIPPDDSPSLYVRIVNTAKGDKTYELKLDEKFWKTPLSE